MVEDPFVSRLAEVAGVSAHPNFVGWTIDFQSNWTHGPSLDTMLGYSPEKAMEFVLANAALLGFVTLSFASKFTSSMAGLSSFVSASPLFCHCSNDAESMNDIGKAAAMMALMLIKLTNRSKSDFDPDLDF